MCASVEMGLYFQCQKQRKEKAHVLRVSPALSQNSTAKKITTRASDAVLEYKTYHLSRVLPPFISSRSCG